MIVWFVGWIADECFDSFIISFSFWWYMLLVCGGVGLWVIGLSGSFFGLVFRRVVCFLFLVSGLSFYWRWKLVWLDTFWGYFGWVIVLIRCRWYWGLNNFVELIWWVKNSWSLCSSDVWIYWRDKGSMWEMRLWNR